MLLAPLAAVGLYQPRPFGVTAGAGNGAGTGQDGAGGIIPGSANDPTSPAYFQQTVGDRVLFAVDQSTLSPQAQATLDGQAQWLMTNSDYTAVIEGHADEQGTREYNLALGARRANAVKEYLIARGVSGEPAAHRELWQGTPDRDLLGRGLLCQEPPRRDGDLGRRADELSRKVGACTMRLSAIVVWP